MSSLSAATESFVEVWEILKQNNYTQETLDFNHNLSPTRNFGTNSSIFEPFRSLDSNPKISGIGWLDPNSSLLIYSDSFPIKIFSRNGLFLDSIQNSQKTLISAAVFDKFTKNGIIIADNKNLCVKNYNLDKSDFENPLYYTKNPISSLATTPNCDTVATGASLNGEITTYNRILNIKHKLSSQTNEKISALAFSLTKLPMLVSGDNQGSIEFFDFSIKNSTPITKISKTHFSPISSIKFNPLSPDTMYSAAMDGFIGIFDIRNKKNITDNLIKCSSALSSMEIDNNYGIFTGDIFGKVSYYDTRNLKAQIWDRYVGLKTKVISLKFCSENPNTKDESLLKMKSPGKESHKINSSKKFNTPKNYISNENPNSSQNHTKNMDNGIQDDLINEYNNIDFYEKRTEGSEDKHSLLDFITPLKKRKTINVNKGTPQTVLDKKNTTSPDLMNRSNNNPKINYSLVKTPSTSTFEKGEAHLNDLNSLLKTDHHKTGNDTTYVHKSKNSGELNERHILIKSLERNKFKDSRKTETLSKERGNSSKRKNYENNNFESPSNENSLYQLRNENDGNTEYKANSINPLNNDDTNHVKAKHIEKDYGFLNEIIKSTIRDAINENISLLQTEIQSVHLDVIKQNYLLQKEIMKLQNIILEDKSSIEEVKSLKKENKILQKYIPRDLVIRNKEKTQKDTKSKLRYGV
ncbi:hypothetical protein BB558_000988 [Smittium angustum]|uniref:Uncharacterized protein n=1 Tax=Smittium angustum TaxID=133377 RepID=A0A2U1JCM5_SMIAN|nr:hypothetical protein BB558_000988 [Smittium angustum]